MKLYLISDNVDTQIGMRLAGVEGCVVHERTEITAAIEKAMEDKSIGILLITEKLGEKVRDYISEIKLNHDLPLIAEIPDRHGSRDVAGSINALVRESIGLKL